MMSSSSRVSVWARSSTWRRRTGIRSLIHQQWKRIDGASDQGMRLFVDLLDYLELQDVPVAREDHQAGQRLL